MKSFDRKSGYISLRGLEIVEIKPIMLGGDPNDYANKTVLSRQDHIRFVVYWNRKLRELRRQRGPDS